MVIPPIASVGIVEAMGGTATAVSTDPVPPLYQFRIRSRVFRWYAQLRAIEDRFGREAIAGYTSGGEQQMCAIGRALMARPKLLMLDEPSMGLAPIFVEKIFEIIGEINEQGTTILLVEQNALMALDAAQRGYVLETGRVALTDDAKSLRENEQVRKTYLGET